MLATASRQSNGRDAIEEDTVDDTITDTSTQGRVIGNSGSSPEEIIIYDSNQDDDDDCSLQTLSNLSLTKEPYQELENDFYHNQNYLKHFFQVLPNLSDCPPVPELKRDKYMFSHEDEMYDTDIDNMSRETENEYVIMKVNCKVIKDMCEDHPQKELAFTRQVHEWNWYCWNRYLRGQIHEWCGEKSFYTRPYAKIGGKSTGFSIQGYKVNWTNEITKAFNLLL